MKKVVIINSNREYLVQLSDYIESLGYSVLERIHCKSQLLQSNSIESASAAIIDSTVELKNDGLDFARMIKKSNRSIAIIFTIKKYSPVAVDQFLSFSPSRILFKPVNRSELKITLKMLLSGA